jgi:hypothetical protein
MRHKHLVYVPKAQVLDVAENIQNGFLIDQVGFLANETKNSIDFVTSFMFTSLACRKNQFVTINKFTRINMTWTDSAFYPKKYRNFHNCKLTFGTHLTTGTSLNLIMIETLGELFKFQIERDLLTDVVQARYFDLLDIFMEFNGDIDFIVSVPYVFGDVKFLIPPGEPYTQLEKMFLMFDFEVWIAIIVTFVVSIVTIQVINLTTMRIQHFVYGRFIATPTLNLISIFLNGGQFKIPGRNFSRFLLMLFIVWSLIIRTCYQSELFKWLQSDARKPKIKSIDELIERNFTWYMPIGYDNIPNLDEHNRIFE